MAQSDFIDHFGPQAAAYAAYRPTYPPALFVYLANAAPARKLAWDRFRPGRDSASRYV